MIGIFGGTFDPIHHGHLRVALDVTEALGLRQVRFLPLQQPVHRAGPAADGAQRLAMVEAALAGEPRFVADDRELTRGGPSYTLDTLRSLRAELGDSVPLCLLLGADAFDGFTTWREPEQVADLAHLVVMQRPGCGRPTDAALRALVERRGTERLGDLQHSSGGRIWFQTVTQLDIAATDIRARIAAGRSPRYLTPDAVINVIAREGLYAQPRT